MKRSRDLDENDSKRTKQDPPTPQNPPAKPPPVPVPTPQAKPPQNPLAKIAPIPAQNRQQPQAPTSAQAKPQNQGAAPKLRGKDLEVSLLANYYDVKIEGHPTVHLHTLKLEPDIRSRRLIVGLLHNIPELNEEFYLGSENQLYHFRDLGEITREVQARRGDKITVSITKKASVNQGAEALFNFYRLLIIRLLKAKKFLPIGRAYFDPKAPIQIHGGNSRSITLWPGFKASLENLISGPHLLVDVKHKVICNETVLEFLIKKRNSKKIHEVQDALIGRSVRTKYNNKFYVISDINLNTDMRTQQFKDDKTGKMVSVWDYMMQSYSTEMAEIEKNVEKKNQPLLECEKKTRGGDTIKIYLVPSLCILTGLTTEMREDYTLMKEMKKCTLLAPQESMNRYGKLIEGFADPKLKEEAKIRSWDIQISKNPIRVKAQVFAKDLLCMRTKDGKITTLRNDCGVWVPFLQDLSYYSVSNGVKWAVIFPEKIQKLVESVIETLTKVAKGVGLMLKPPNLTPLARDSPKEYYDAMQALDSSTDFAFCFLRDNLTAEYQAIKSVLCSDNPIISQCVRLKTISKPGAVMGVCNNIVLQIVGKIGGIPWRFEGNIFAKPTMVIGVEMSHNKGKPSSVGFVASLDSIASNKFQYAYQNPANHQYITQFGDFVTRAFAQFSKVNSKDPNNPMYPSCVVVYRDGLGESQMKGVIKEECRQIKAAVKEMKAAVDEIIYVVVQKRIDTRFLVEGGNKVSNVQSGTLVETDLVASENVHKFLKTSYDFFLVSQSHAQAKVVRGGLEYENAAGTIRPAHYWVKHKMLRTSAKPTPRYNLERLTFNLSHLYFNWTGTVSVPAVCKEAKGFAMFSAKYLNGKAMNPKMQGKLPFM